MPDHQIRVSFHDFALFAVFSCFTPEAAGERLFGGSVCGSYMKHVLNLGRCPIFGYVYTLQDIRAISGILEIKVDHW